MLSIGGIGDCRHGRVTRLFGWGCIAVAACMAVSAAALAAPISPHFDTFGTLSGATFGGSGIPNNAVAITFGGDDDHDVTLGLTAHARFFNPTVTNDGAGTFFATPGANYGDPTFTTTPSTTLGATWNFAFYIDVGEESRDVRIRLLYDFDPGYFTDESNHGVIETTVESSSVVELQGSQNAVWLLVDRGHILWGSRAFRSGYRHASPWHNHVRPKRRRLVHVFSSGVYP